MVWLKQPLSISDNMYHLTSWKWENSILLPPLLALNVIQTTEICKCALCDVRKGADAISGEHPAEHLHKVTGNVAFLQSQNIKN